jgi:hypothetical protein
VRGAAAAIGCALAATSAYAQGLTGSIIGIVTDEQGAVMVGAQIRVRSNAVLAGEISQLSSDKGQMRFLALPPGTYDLEVAYPGFVPFRETGLQVGAGTTIERTVRLTLAGRSETVVVERAGPRLDARDPGFSTRFGHDDLARMPSRRASMFDWVRMAPGISPTSPASGTQTTVAAFGSGTNENLFLIDGTNFTCPCNGIARSEPGIDFIDEIHVQSVGASAEYGNMQGAVINIITRQGSERLQLDASFYTQPSFLTSQPVALGYGSGDLVSRYERVRYRDVTANIGGPLLRRRAWFFGGYQYLRDVDSQPGADPAFPRIYEQNKVAAKLTWRPVASWQLVHTFHGERLVNPEAPTRTKPIGSTQRRHASVPAVTFVHLTQTLSTRTVWDVRIGRFVHARRDDLQPGAALEPSRFDQVTGVWSGAPAQLGSLTLVRTTGKATVTHYRADAWGADHQWKYGVQIERGEGHGHGSIPTGVRFVDVAGQPFQAISSEPSRTGGLFITAGIFVSDAISVGDRLTVNAGARFDHSRAVSEDLRAIDAAGEETTEIVRGLGTLFTWNVVSPRLGATLKLTADGRTILRGSYGRFAQGPLTGEYSAFHPGVTPVTTRGFEPSTGGYTRLVRVGDSRVNLRLDPGIRAPRTDEYSVGVDREVLSHLAIAAAYVHKRGANFIGWTDVGGQYRNDLHELPDGRLLPVYELTNSSGDQRFLLTNPDGYTLTYHGVVVAVEKRRSSGWRLFGSYTASRTEGLQASSGGVASAAQSSTVALPTVPIGRDPNDLTNASGRLPNDRPHILRVMTSVEVPRTGLVVAASAQHLSGKPWAATAQVLLPQGSQRILLETPGTRRLSSQTLLDFRISYAVRLQRVRLDFTVDVLNALDDTAEEGLASDQLSSPSFGQPTTFIDPRRAMISVRLGFGR